MRLWSERLQTAGRWKVLLLINPTYWWRNISWQVIQFGFLMWFNSSRASQMYVNMDASPWCVHHCSVRPIPSIVSKTTLIVRRNHWQKWQYNMAWIYCHGYWLMVLVIWLGFTVSWLMVLIIWHGFTVMANGSGDMTWIYCHGQWCWWYGLDLLSWLMVPRFALARTLFKQDRPA